MLHGCIELAEELGSLASGPYDRLEGIAHVLRELREIPGRLYRLKRDALEEFGGPAACAEPLKRIADDAVDAAERLAKRGIYDLGRADDAVEEVCGGVVIEALHKLVDRLGGVLRHALE